MHLRNFLALPSALLASTLAAQSPAPGYRLFGLMGGTDTVLMDTAGNVVQTWPSTWIPGTGIRLDDDGTLVRATRHNTTLLIGGIGGGVQRIALDGTLLWDYVYDGPGFVSHHDIEVMPNGNVLLIAWEERTIAEAIANGRNPAYLDPAILTDGFLRPDRIVEIQQTGPTTGQVVWEWYVWDHMIQDFDDTKANYGPVGDHPELIDINFPPVTPFLGDWNHGNSLSYDAEHDWIYFTPKDMGEFWVIDHSTTTAEAAGHTGGLRGKGGDLLYRWGNPQAYRAGTIFDQRLWGHHAAVLIPDDGRLGGGNIIIFNNEGFGTASNVWELEMPLDENDNFVFNTTTGRYDPVDPIWSYGDPSPAHPEFHFSQFVSNAERLPNGNTLVCSGMEGWIFEVTPQKQIVWEHFTGGEVVFHAHYVAERMWADTPTISLSTGGVVNFQMIAGSESLGKAHYLLGSASGTSPGLVLDGVPLPLNVDGYFVNTLAAPNVYPLTNSLGFFDAQSQASASFELPNFLPPELVGLVFDHAYVVLNPSTGLVDLASNAVSTTLIP